MPSFFSINIDCEGSEFLTSPEAQRTLLHEYVHYIQDVTTIYGLGNTVGRLNYILECFAELERENKNFDGMPVARSGGDSAADDLNYYELFFGSFENVKLNENPVLLDVESIPNPIRKDIDDTYVRYSTDLQDINYSKIGARVVVEHMATAVETLIGGEPSLPWIPYGVLRDYVDFVGGYDDWLTNGQMLCLS